MKSLSFKLVVIINFFTLQRIQDNSDYTKAVLNEAKNVKYYPRTKGELHNIRSTVKTHLILTIVFYTKFYFLFLHLVHILVHLLTNEY